MGSTTSETLRPLPYWQTADTMTLDVCEYERQLAAKHNRPRSSRCGYKLASVDDLDRATIHRGVATYRVAICATIVFVSFATVAVTSSMSPLSGALITATVAALLATSRSRTAIWYRIHGLAFRQVLRRRLQGAQRDVRAAHSFVRKVVVGRARCYLSYDDDNYFLTAHRAADLLHEFAASDIRTARVRVERHIERSWIGQDSLRSAVVLTVETRSPMRPILDICFGVDEYSARVWCARMLSSADRQRQRADDALIRAAERGIDHRHHHEHIRRYEWVRCTYCGHQYHADHERCAECGALPAT